ncbi:hypothetical protein PTSG_00868 [Salpingoeca rosetta]|uniref:Guanylate cyclase domain-containing protein n=1 Tax=Salpingoeca rosetta (strain ATCC 50818 / BSB-021) TaxID=946362 RepID=F2TXQ2_SALR5|nr:uncharacterized protein PTSG_00868 [Salpingoeca rosetta]EGD76161.1 hypothetical protein PTSG_00868 [Salpingoeca rosetta]|eukprot:XP_004998336.1 hypothetical protein PTSG_00868 [Salpingoeca rosetta]
MNADETGIQIHAFKEPVLSHALGFRLSRYVPKVVRAKMDRSRKPYDIAELRQVSVMFVKISGLSLDPDANGTCMTAVKNAQLLMTELQRVVFNYEGVVNKLLVDDKGLLALVVFGLPPFLHQDDAARAVRAGIDIANDVPRLDTTQTINASVGIATGHVFAGIIGSRQRHEYTVMGDSVNKAARLMVTATAYGVVIDETTKRAVKIQVPSFQYDKLEDLTLKGFSKRAKAYHPHPLQDNTSVWMTTGMPARMDNMLFGREEDIEAGLKMLRSTYDKLGGLLYVKADVAMGTTPVAMKLTQEAKKLGMFVISPSPSQVIKIGDYGTEQLARSRRNISTCIASDNKWAIWREVLKTAFRRLKDAGVQSLRKWVIECLEPFDDQIDLTWTLPAVDRVLSEFEHFDPREDPPLKSTRRSSIIRDSDVESLIVRVMLGFVSLFPTFIALRLDVQKHDGHGALDHYSWQVTERLAAHCCDRSGELESPPVIILVMSEHHNEDSPFASYDVLRRAVSAGTLLPLKLLTKATQCMSFMKPKDVVVLPASIPPPVTQLIDQRCGGHPWMIHKTISLMFSPNACGPGSGPAIQKWETGRIAIVTKDIGQVRVTEDMAKCLLSSYEALRGRLQLIVKTAAVMPAFSPEMVQALLPESPAHVLQRELDDLVERGILEHSNTVPRCVDNYWPSDRTTSYHYEFACKLQQRLIVDITPHSLVKHNRECFHARISKVTFSVMTIQAAWRRYLLRTKPKLEWLLNGQAPQPQPVYTTRVAQAVIQIMKGMQIMQGEDAAHKLPDSYAQLSVTRSRQRANTNWLDMEAAIMGISGDDDGTSSDAGTNAMSDDSQREALEQRSLAGADAVIDAVGEREGQGREGAETRRVRYASAGHERTDSVGSDSSSGGGAAAIHDFSDPEPLAAEREGQDNDGGGDDGNSESQLDLVSFDGDSECEEQWAGHGQSAAGADGAGDAAVVHRNASNDTAECDDDLEPGFHAPPVPIRRRITRSQSPTPYVIPAGLRQKLEARHLTVSTVGTERAKRTEIGIVTEAVTHLLIQANDRLVRIRKGCMDIDARMGAVTDQMDALSDAFQDMVARISAEIEVEDTESS